MNEINFKNDTFKSVVTDIYENYPNFEVLIFTEKMKVIDTLVFERLYVGSGMEFLGDNDIYIDNFETFSYFNSPTLHIKEKLSYENTQDILLVDVQNMYLTISKHIIEKQKIYGSNSMILDFYIYCLDNMETDNKEDKIKFKSLSISLWSYIINNKKVKLISTQNKDYNINTVMNDLWSEIKDLVILSDTDTFLVKGYKNLYNLTHTLAKYNLVYYTYTEKDEEYIKNRIDILNNGKLRNVKEYPHQRRIIRNGERN